MAIDIGAALLVLSMGYFGFVTGSVFQLIRLVILVVASVLAYLVGKQMAIFHLGTSPELQAAEAATYWFFISLAVLWGLGAVGTKTLTTSARDASIDRTTGDALGGALLGGARGFVLAFMLVLGMHSLYQTQKTFDLPYTESKLFQFADSKNFLRAQAGALQTHLDANFTTDDEEESDVGTIGDLPSDERSVLP